MLLFPEKDTGINNMKENIKQLLHNLEKQYEIKILFAIENGSRVWDMASKNSDYDVRFVFYRNADKYLSLTREQEVINLGFNEELQPCPIQGSIIDMSGFDIFKYLRLLYKSNPTTIEWLFSDILYFGNNDLSLRRYIQDNFSQQTLYLHYFSLFKKTYKKNILNKKTVTYKKYLYSARGLINALYVLNFNRIPPSSIKQTIEEVKNFLPEKVCNKLYDIIKIKSQGLEQEKIFAIEELDDFFNSMVNSDIPILANKTPKLEDLNQFLHKQIFNEVKILSNQTEKTSNLE